MSDGARMQSDYQKIQHARKTGEYDNDWCAKHPICTVLRSWQRILHPVWGQPLQ